MNLFIIIVCVFCPSATQDSHPTQNLQEDELDKLFDRKFAEKERIYEARERKIAERELNLERRVKALETALTNGVENRNNSKRFVAEAPLSTPIGFTACVSPPDLKNLGARHTILFDKVITNMGSGYHSNLGVFEAPLKGLYVFHVTAMTRPGDEQYINFMKDGSAVGNIYPDSRGTSAFQTVPGTWVLELDQNSEVYVQTAAAGEIHGYCYTTFSGFLLQELE